MNNSVITNDININNIQNIRCDKYALSPACNSSNIYSLLQCEIKNVKVYLEQPNNTIFVGENSIFEDCGFYIQGKNNQILIGSDCKIRGTYFILLGNDNKITIGDNTTTNGLYWGYNHIHCAEGHNINIGQDCMLSGGIVIRNSDGHSILNENDERINHSKDIIIKDHVWIGEKSILLKNSQIGNNCIIGANSVVTKRFKDNTIIAGNPATGKKLNGTWIRENI